MKSVTWTVWDWMLSTRPVSEGRAKERMGGAIRSFREPLGLRGRPETQKVIEGDLTDEWEMAKRLRRGGNEQISGKMRR